MKLSALRTTLEEGSPGETIEKIVNLGDREQ